MLIDHVVSENNDANHACTWALNVLCNLAVEETNKNEMWNDSYALRHALIKVAGLKGHENQERALGIWERALAILWQLAADEDNAKKIWNNNLTTRASVIRAAKTTGPADRKARSYGLAALLNLSSHDPNKVAMCENLEVRAALMQAAGGPDSKDRGIAMATLHNFSTLSENRFKLWTDKQVRDRVVNCANRRDPNNCQAGVRAHALGVLANCAMDDACKQVMWSEENGVLNCASMSPDFTDANTPRTKEYAAIVLKAHETYQLEKAPSKGK